MNDFLIIFAKNPRPGKVKTRLIPHLTPKAAAELYKAFLIDIVNSTHDLNCSKVIIAYTPSDAEEAFRSLIGGEVDYIQQKGRNLGGRMRNAFNRSFAGGAERVVIIGTDSPSLPITYIQKAFKMLKKTSVVIGPTFDGGYYLIGLSKPNDYIFTGIKWGTSKVFGQTLERINTVKESLCLLPPWYDIDTSKDLEFLKSHLLAMKMSERKDLPENTLQLLNI